MPDGFEGYVTVFKTYPQSYNHEVQGANTLNVYAARADFRK